MEVLSVKNITLRYVLFFCAVVLINIFMVFLDNNSYAGVVWLWILCVLCVIYSRFNFFHPLSWFSIVFTLYYSSYAILYLIYNVNFAYGLSGVSLRLSVLALSTVVIICGFPSNEKYYSKDSYKNIEKNLSFNDFSVLEKSIIICIIIAFVLTIIVSRSFVSKRMSTKDNLFSICTYLIRALTFLCGLYILARNEFQKKTIIIISLCGIVCAMFGFLNAERDCILRFILVVFLTLIFNKVIKPWHLIFLFPIGIVLMVVLNTLKYFFIDKSLKVFAGGLIQSFLSSDFGASGGNLQNLINHNFKGIAGYSTIFTDIVRGVFPFIKVGTNYNVWYNNLFFKGSYSRAFTLVGEGYLIDGSIGIVVLFILVALIIVFLTKRIQKNLWSTMIYIYGVITIVSSFRGTLIDIVTGLVRTPLIAIFIFLIVQAIYNKGRIKFSI